MAKAWPIRGLTRKASFGESAGRTLLTRAAEVAASLDKAGDRSDIEGLHSLRVALRRLRAAMAAYAAVFPQPAWDRLRVEATALFRPTSALRDVDVQAARLRALRAQAPPHAEVGIDVLLAELAAEEAVAADDVKRAVEVFVSSDFCARLASLVEAVTGISAEEQGVDSQLRPQVSDASVHAAPATAVVSREEVTPNKAATARARKRGGRRLARRLDRLRSGYEPLMAGPGWGGAQLPPDARHAHMEELHKVRILVKKLRYTAEIFAPVLDGKLKGQASSLGRLQDLLGEVHDAAVAEERAGRRLGAVAARHPETAGLCYVLADARGRSAAHVDHLRLEWTPSRVRSILDGVAEVAISA